MADLVEVMKKAGLAAVEASKPVNALFGVVVSGTPLKINVEQKITLESAQLVLSRAVTNHVVEMTVEHWTEQEQGHTHPIQDTYSGGGVCAPTQHTHAYKGRKRFLVHSELVVGDKVILLREQGGQRFFVLDRVGVME